MKAIVFGNIKRKEVAYYAARLITELHRKGIQVVCESSFVDFLHVHGVDTAQVGCVPDNGEPIADIAFSVGGDGTFIRSVAKIGKMNIPLLGINAGRLGFLADVSGENEIGWAVEKIANGNYKVEDRPLLKLKTDDHSFNDFNYAINEIAVLKQDTASMIAINTKINGEYITKYQADGLIIATATGSTAYAMSVGGPIIVPQAANFILTPVAPHSLSMRPLVLTDDCEIELKVESRNQHFLISLDGRSNVFHESTRLIIKKASFSMHTIRLEGHSFFSTLREKLMWGSDQRRY